MIAGVARQENRILEAEILDRLAIIENTLVAQTILLVFVLTGLLMIVVFAWLARRSQVASNLKQAFFNHAQLLEDQGNYNDLLQLARQRRKEYESDIWAKWFCAMALYKLKRDGEALAAFADIRNSDPAWQRDIIAEYIDSIRARMNGPKKTDS